MLLDLIYIVAILFLSPVLMYEALRKGKYRSGWSEKLLGNVPRNLHTIRDDEQNSELRCSGTVKRIWVHAVSVGEVNLAVGLVKELQQSCSSTTGADSLQIVVSTTTVTGYELAQKKFPPQTVFYCPLDFTWAIRKALRRIRPDLIVLVELEIWPNWLRLACKANVPVAVVNGRLSEKSFRGYYRLRFLLRATFARLSLVAAQDDTYTCRFLQMGVGEQKVYTTGSLKFDDAPTTRQTQQIQQYRELIQAEKGHIIFVAGSTQAGEERVALEVYAALQKDYPQLRLIVVPRHADRFDEVSDTINQQGFTCVRRSRLDVGFSGNTSDELGGKTEDSQSAKLDTWNTGQVVLVDTIGELRAWWGLADIAFVGGSLGNRGGQNMLEPSGYGAAVCFGPNTGNFRDIVSKLLAVDAARVVTDAESMREFIEEMILYPDRAIRMGQAASMEIARHQGARKRTVDLLVQLLNGSKPAS